MFTIKKLLVYALNVESRIILAKYKPFVVAVTGSVGKTSTKDAIYSVLKNHERYARRSEKSMNSEIGLPLTIIGVPNAWRDVAGWARNIILGLKLIFKKTDYPNCLILEIGADHPGDIKKLANWLHPDIAVITRVSKTPVHVEFFRSAEEVFEEKSALARAVKVGGALVLFSDDEKVMTLRNIAERKGISVILFGLNDKAVVRGSDARISGSLSGYSFDLNIDGKTSPIAIKNALSKSHAYALLAAAAVGKARGLGFDEIVKGLHDYEAPKGRMNVIPGFNNSTIIDDTYNSSPDAVLSALETLKEIKITGRKISVLGDMMELGKYSAEEHRKIGKEVAGVADVLITVGPRSRATAEEAIKNGLAAEAVQSFDSSLEAAPYLTSVVRAGDVILVKGSQLPRLERVVKSLLRDSEKADKLLVRQEEEWMKR